jgi:hypothetical protein
MLLAPNPAPEGAGQVLTWDEIHARYPDEWILFAEPAGPADHFRFDTARLLAHGPVRKTVLSQAADFLTVFPGVGSLFTGRVRLSPHLTAGEPSA